MKQFTKGSKWVGAGLIALMTIICIIGTIAFKSQTKIEFPDDHAVQAVMWESFMVLLIWAWFSLFWNMYSTKYVGTFKTLPPATVRRRNELLEE